jgi:hypothetical protein
MAHAFKGRTGTYKGKSVLIIRGAHKGDVNPGVELKGDNFLIQAENGDRKVVPVAEVKIATAQAIEAPHVADKDSF